MKSLKILLVLSLLFFLKRASGQSSAEYTADTTTVNVLLQQSKDSLTSNPNKAISLAMQARDLAEKSQFLKGKAYALKNIGLGNYYQGKYVETLDYWNQSLSIF